MNLNEEFENFMREELSEIQAMPDGNDRDARLKNFAQYWKEYKKAMVADSKIDLDRLEEKYKENKFEMEKAWKERELQLSEQKFEYQKVKDVNDAEYNRDKLKKDTISSRFGSIAQITMGLCTLGAALINLAGVKDTNATRLEQTKIVSNVEDSGEIISGQKTKFLEK